MVANKSKGTKIELLLAKVLWNHGIRYRKNDKGILGTPDFSLRGYKIAIFCDGDFWHGKDWEINKEKIKSNRAFWYHKIERNIERDQQITIQLQARGWKVFRFWETDIRKDPEKLADQVLLYIHGLHYLSNQTRPAAEPFEKPAKEIISHLYNLADNSPSFDSLVAEPEIQYSLGSNIHTAPFLPPADASFSFVDLFAGLGGIRLALQQLGGQCVFCSEVNPEAQHTYLLNFGEVPFGDITDQATKSLIPDTFDLLCAHIPAQRFLHANKKKGIEKLYGTFFYHFTDILNKRKPKAFLLETDKRFLTTDKGKNINILLDSIKDETGYNLSYTTINKRAYIVGIYNNLGVQQVVLPSFPDYNYQDSVSLSPLQLAQALGYPVNFILRMKKTTAYKLLKNASSISSIKAIGKIVLEALKCNF